MLKSTHSKKQSIEQILVFPGLLSYLVCYLPYYLCAHCIWTHLHSKLFTDEVRLCIQLVNNHSRLQVHRPSFHYVLTANQISPAMITFLCVTRQKICLTNICDHHTSTSTWKHLGWRLLQEAEPDPSISHALLFRMLQHKLLWCSEAGAQTYFFSL